MTSWRILEGDALERLRDLPSDSVHCVVTSPPYWGLRDYNVAGQLGLERSFRTYLDRLVVVFEEVKRVLRPDGTLWLNMGDSYVSGQNEGTISETDPRFARDRAEAKRAKRSWRRDRAAVGNDPHAAVPGLKLKDMMGQPWRTAFALQDAGWWLRRDIIWEKPNCTPESVYDRPSSAHEYIFLMSKRKRYFYDRIAIAEPTSPDSLARLGRAHAAWEPPGQHEHRGVVGPRPNTNGGKSPSGWNTGPGGHHKSGGRYRSGNKQRDIPTAADGRGIPNDHRGRGIPWEDTTGLRNTRSVWRIPTFPFPEAHFATFPPELARRCISAGSSEKGCCGTCGAQAERVVTTSYRNDTTTDGRPARGNNVKTGARRAGSKTMASGVRTRRHDETVGWQRTCAHDGPLVPCTVLDPFAGAGTTLMVAERLGRDSIGIELNPEYAAIARRRIETDPEVIVARTQVRLEL